MIKQLNVDRDFVQICNTGETVRLQVVSFDAIFVSPSPDNLGVEVSHKKGIVGFSDKTYIKTTNARSESIVRYETT